MRLVAQCNLAFGRWYSSICSTLDRAFEHVDPHKSFSNPGKATLMDLCDVSILGSGAYRRLRRKLLGTRYYERVFPTIVKNIRYPPDEREKCVMYIVRGPGTGKTRSLEAIRMRLGATEGFLVLPITFNSRFGLQHEAEPPIEQLGNVRQAARTFIVAVAKRMLAVFYNLPMEDKRLAKLFDDIDVGMEEIVRQTVVHIVKKAQRHRNINSFLLLVDELQLAEGVINRLFALRDKDIAFALRSAMLDVEIVPGMYQGLLVAGLTAQSVGWTDSGRGITPIRIPPSHEPAEIVDQWWAESSLVRTLLQDPAKRVAFFHHCHALWNMLETLLHQMT
eukprot:TRINITY_DN25512_c0_g1_i1.p1 TRINITY_DN25512_c0_g1~~TRINITY_DN25512_c0_g1_i1.p1  ORF type:complete len:341 (-),score=45.10 TRINITY_DN25512_c0_g1_i1:133-1134(-)